jgi:hypothetical protein
VNDVMTILLLSAASAGVLVLLWVAQKGHDQ